MIKIDSDKNDEMTDFLQGISRMPTVEEIFSVSPHALLKKQKRKVNCSGEIMSRIIELKDTKFWNLKTQS